jgi:hypothetical protein
VHFCFVKSSGFNSVFAILLSLLAFITACSKTATTTNNPPPVPPVDTTVLSNDPDIYTTGTVSTYSNHFAAYWKNKQFFQLSDTESYANCITVVDSDVYVAGYGGLNKLACYWKNGVFNSLYHGYFSENTTDICSSGQDVYISGYGRISMTQVAEYWKNGQPVVMPPVFDHALAYGIAVSGSDVYLVGTAYNATSRSQAILWKNGTVIPLTDGSNFAAATGIFIQGSDVYICGEETDNNDSFYVAKYWKNGQPVILSDTTSTCFTNSIFVDQNDVYVAGVEHPGTILNPIGQNSRAIYWKNGVETKLFTGTEDSHTYTILTWDSDLYLTYNIYNNLEDSTTSPRYLKNQIPQLVDFGSFIRGDINDIFIKSKH